MFRIFAIVCLIVSNGFLLAMSFEGTLYGDFMQKHRNRISAREFTPSLKRPQVYEHLDPSRSFETRKYVKYFKRNSPRYLRNNKLVVRFMRDFLIPPRRWRHPLKDLLQRLVLRDVGRLEIELLMTKMLVRKNFWHRVNREMNTRRKELERAALKYIKEKNKKNTLDFLSACYAVSNILKFLIDPESPDRVLGIICGMEDIADILNKFSVKNSESADLIEEFFKNVETEPAFDVSIAESIIIDVDSDNRSLMLNLLKKLYSESEKMTRVFSKMRFRRGENDFNGGEGTVPPVVSIDYKAYNKKGISFAGGYYCYTNLYYPGRTNLGVQQQTKSGVMFHELDHALHHWEGRIKYSQESLSEMYGLDRRVEMWSNDEEFLNILGMFYDRQWFIDPICCAVFCRTQRRPNRNMRCFHSSPPLNFINAETNPDEIPLETVTSDIPRLKLFIITAYNHQ